MPADGGRPDQRPDWLKRKHGRGAHLDERTRARQQVLDTAVRKALDAGTPRQTGYRGGPFPSREAADRVRRELYNAGKRLTRRGEPVSVAAYLTDPGTGKCPHCDGWPSDQAHCRPSPRDGIYVHYRAFPKKSGRQYMIDHYGPNPADWPFDIFATGPYQPPQAETGRTKNGQRFGIPATPAADSEDPPSAAPRLGSTTSPSRDREKARDVKAGGGKPEQQGIMGKLLRGQ